MRDYTRISAPFSGVVTAKSVEPGNLAAPGAPLLTVEREGAYRLEASVDESRLPFVKAGQAVDVALESLDRRFAARVSEIVPAVDAASRAYIVKIDLPAVPNLRSGMFGRAMFPLGTRKVADHSAAAMVEHGQLQSVFVDRRRLRAHAPGDHRRATADRRRSALGIERGRETGEPGAFGLADGARWRFGNERGAFGATPSRSGRTIRRTRGSPPS